MIFEIHNYSHFVMASTTTNSPPPPPDEPHPHSEEGDECLKFLKENYPRVYNEVVKPSWSRIEGEIYKGSLLEAAKGLVEILSRQQLDESRTRDGKSRFLH